VLANHLARKADACKVAGLARIVLKAGESRLLCLPAKNRATQADIREYLDRLVDLGMVAHNQPVPSHDQLQALVAGLGGLGVVANTSSRYEALGTKPFLLDDVWREGYIVCPCRASLQGNG
jgi:hypothetical protein